MADETVETAYNAVVNNQKVSLSNPANSRLVLKTLVDNHNCGGAVACEQFAVEMEAAIRTWADAVAAASSPFANNVTALAELVVLNYLGLHGQQGMFGTNVLAGNGLGTGAAVDPYIAFNPIV